MLARVLHALLQLVRRRHPSATTFLIAAVIFSGPFLPIEAEGVTLKPGDIVYADAGGCCGPRTIFHIDGTTLARSVISVDGYFEYPVDLDIVTTTSGYEIVVGDLAALGSGAVIRVDPSTSAQSVVSSGPPFVNPSGIHVRPNGEILVGDPLALSTSSFGALFGVDPTTGDKSVLCAGGFSEATDPSRNFGVETQIALEPAGTILMTSPPYFYGSTANPDAKILRCQPATGEVTVVLVGGSGVLLGSPAGIAVSPAGDIFVSDSHGATVGAGLMRIDPVTAAQTLICSNVPGASSGQASKLTLDSNGNLLAIVNFPDNSNGIIRIRPPFTAATCSYDVIGQGSNTPSGFYSPAGIRVVPAATPPPDADSDGIPDNLDVCPNTPAGSRVDTRGCSIPFYGLGDSVASGYGLPDVDGEDDCRRAPSAYPHLVSGALGLLDRGDFACRGATAFRDSLEPDKTLDSQVQRVLMDLADIRSAEPGARAVVTITIGADDFEFSDVDRLIERLCRPEGAFEAWVDTTVRRVRDNLIVQVGLLVAAGNVDVVVTDYYNPFNTGSHPTLLALAPDSLKCKTSNFYPRTEQAIHSLNEEIRASVDIVNAFFPDGHVRFVSIHTKFHGHEAPRLFCGTAAPELYDSWIQTSANSPVISYIPVDCVHPNLFGAFAIAEEVVEVLEEVLGP